MPPLDSDLFRVAGVTHAKVGGRAHAIVTSAQAHRHASRPRHVRGADNVATVARAPIQTGALAVQARQLAERFASARRGGDASAGVGVEREALVAGATIGAHARAVRTATVLASRLARVSRPLRTPARRRIHGHPVVADAHVRPHAQAPAPASVPALERGRERDALPRVRIQLESQVAGALFRADAVRVRAAIQSAIGHLRLGRDGGASAVGVARVPDAALAHARRHALAVRATLGTVRRAIVLGVERVARLAVAHVRRHASPVHAASGTSWHALFAARLDRESRLTGAGTGRHAITVHATSRAVGHASVGGGGVEGEAWLALAHAWRDALAVHATSRTVGHARVAPVENVIRLALADARGDAFAVGATGGTVGDTVFGIVSGIDESGKEKERKKERARL